ncbi:arylamine N-acetyltransferase family protein [Sphingomonas citri]|jgi:N-hydroxyarylamine O-acetyltransferase
MFDLDAYLARIELPARPTRDAAGLARLQLAHRLTIPFENLDVRLGRGIAIDGESVAAKLVGSRRGGYCFEHNRLLLDALDALEMAARPLLARVWLGAEATPPRNHALSLVTIDGAEWIADTGFGASYAPVMPLVADQEATAPDGARFRLAREEDGGWLLLRDGDPVSTDGRTAPGWNGTSWQPQYSFTTEAVHDSDLAMANHWAMSAPASRFTQRAVVSVVLPHGFAALTDRRYRRRAAGNTAEGEITDPRVYRMRLSLMFGIDLAKEEVAALGLF